MGSPEASAGHRGVPKTASFDSIGSRQAEHNQHLPKLGKANLYPSLQLASTALRCTMADQNNTFLSRVFGVSSPDADNHVEGSQGAELSSLITNDNNNNDTANMNANVNGDEGARVNSRHPEIRLASSGASGTKNNRDLLVNSDSDSDSSNESDSSVGSNHNLLGASDSNAKLDNGYFSPQAFTGDGGNNQVNDPRLHGALDEDDDNAVPQSLLLGRRHKPQRQNGKLNSLRSTFFEDEEDEDGEVRSEDRFSGDAPPSGGFDSVTRKNTNNNARLGLDGRDQFHSTIQQRGTNKVPFSDTPDESPAFNINEGNKKPLLPLFSIPKSQRQEGQQHNPNNKKRINEERVRRQTLGVLSPREKALWMWANVENLDIFLQDVYGYYLRNGFYCIVIKKVTDLLTLVFIVYFSTYLGYCIDYSKLPSSKRLSEIQYDHCYKNQVSGLAKFFLFLFYGYVAIRLLQFWLVDLKKLREMRDFFRYLLLIEENELQTISWQLIIKKLIILRDTNSNGILISQDSNNDNRQNHKSDLMSKKRLTAHDIANRIMRKENYLVALYNKNILNFQLDLPFVSSLTHPKSILTKTLEWNINLCIIGFVFNNQGQFKPAFLKEQNRHNLSQELRKRFIICGILAIIIAPFLATYFILLNFFRFFYEFRSDPHVIGNREFSPYAEWKFREFNELYHFFKTRLHYSMESASDYLNQFPKERVNLLLRFVSFISGALVTVLVILTIFDPDLSINFEITENKSVLFYIGILGSLWAVAHGATSDDFQNKIFDPECSLKNVAEYTHYLPSEWEGRYHSEEVKVEFAELFQLKVALIIKELLSILFIPFIFWFALPKCADQIIDFFREFTVYIDGLGHVCSFAMFDVEKKSNKDRYIKKDKSKITDRNRDDGDEHSIENADNGYNRKVLHNGKESSSSDEDLREDYYGAADNKMLKSYLHFVESYADNPNNAHQGSSPGNPNQLAILGGNSIASRSMYFSKQFPFGANKRYQPGTTAQLRSSIYEPHDMHDSVMVRSRYHPDRSGGHNRSHNHNQMYTSINNFVGDESYLINLKSNDNGFAHERAADDENADGVLGLLSQFYKSSGGKKI